MSLAQWREEGYKAVWLEVPIHRAALIPAAVSNGFTFHHTGEEYLMLTCELVEGTYLPPFATHYVGMAVWC